MVRVRLGISNKIVRFENKQHEPTNNINLFQKKKTELIASMKNKTKMLYESGTGFFSGLEIRIQELPL
jgi:hypothetical protein